MRRKIAIYLLCICCILGQWFLSETTEAVDEVSFHTPICLTVNGVYLAMDSQPFLHEGFTFVPIRFVSEALGADSVTWDSSRNTATIQQDETTIQLTAGQKTAYVNGEKIRVAQGIRLVNDRVYVPVRFVSETLGCEVLWDSQTYTVAINKKGISVPAHLEGTRGYSDDEIYWLSRIIHAESRGEPMQGKIAVGNVVLNRVESTQFPNTIYGVIFDQKYGVQFSPVADGSIYNTPLGDSVIAAKKALEGESQAGQSLYFFNPRTASSFWIAQNRTYYKTIANHDFYL